MTPTAASVVPLESGDNLTRAEFHRRYGARPDIHKAELIDGVVYVTSRVTAWHGSANASMVGWLGRYVAHRPQLHASIRPTIFLDATCEVQPDGVLYRDEAAGGMIRTTSDHFLEGTPDLIVEVATSSASYDLHQKLNAYRRNWIPEYIAWQLFESRIDWFRLRAGEYIRVEPNADGVVESEAFPGLILHVEKMLAGDVAGVISQMEARRAGKAGGASLEPE